VLELQLRDTAKARELDQDGNYTRAKRRKGQRRLDSQARLLARSVRRGRRS
jgi:polyphosphate kinase